MTTLMTLLMGMGLDPVSLGLGAAQTALGIGQAIGGMINLRKKKREANDAVNAIETYQEDPALKIMNEKQKLRATSGLSGSAKALAQEDANRASAAAMRGAIDRRGGLAMLSSVLDARSKAANRLAMADEQANQMSQAAADRGTMAVSADRGKAFASRQEKQSLKANIAMQEVAAKKAAISQGLTGATMGASNMINTLEGYRREDNTNDVSNSQVAQSLLWGGRMSNSPASSAFLSAKPTAFDIMRKPKF